MVYRNDSGKGVKEYNQGNGQIKNKLACCRKVDGAEGSKGTLSSFLGYKDDGKGDIFSGLQDSLNITFK